MPRRGRAGGQGRANLGRPLPHRQHAYSGRPGPAPAPSSQTLTTSCARLSAPSRTRHARAPEWRTTLLIASTAIRKVGHLDRGGDVGRWVSLEGDLDRCALGQALDMRGDRAGKTEIIQRRRPQAIDDAAQVGDGLRGGVLGLAEQRAEIASGASAAGVTGVTGAGPRGVEVQPDAGQQRTEPVVQIAA